MLVGVRRVLLPFKASARVSGVLSALDTVIMLAYVRFRLYLFGMWFWYSWRDGACLRYADGALERCLQVGHLLLMVSSRGSSN